MTLMEKLVRPLGYLLRKKRAGENSSIQYYQELATDTHFTLQSTAFLHGEEIPTKHAGHGLGDNISPPLHWQDAPSHTKQFLLVIEDIDVPFQKPILHGICLFFPHMTQMPEGAMTTNNKNINCIPSWKGRIGYFGPRPLPGHGVHRYQFHLYALNQVIENPHHFKSLEVLLPAVHHHVIGRATLMGIKEGK